MKTILPIEYAKAAALANEVTDQMLSRLEFVVQQPEVIVDVGCSTGHSTRLLQQRYPKAIVTAIDIAYPLLEYARQTNPSAYVCADTAALPFRDHSVDLIFANLLLPWCNDQASIFREWRRVLRPGGLLMFSSLGPDTLKGWWDNKDLKEGLKITPHLADMHEVGDILTQGRWLDPVMDVEYFTLNYREIKHFFHELYVTAMIDQIPTEIVNEPMVDSWSAMYEVVYGHAWGPSLEALQTADQEGIVRIPLSHLRRSR